MEGAGRRGRDAGVASVMRSEGEDWKAAAVSVALRVRDSREEFTGEDIRLACVKEGISASHPNAWGGLVQGMVRSGMIVETGEWKAARSPRSHARRIPVYSRP